MAQRRGGRKVESAGRERERERERGRREEESLCGSFRLLSHAAFRSRWLLRKD
jgi:hypothetical protein